MDKDVLLFDGAFGTYILEKLPGLARPEDAVLSHPDAVAAIHREYIEAGATAISTATFAINPDTAPDYQKRIAAAVDIAKSAANGRARVFADIGPITGEDAEERYVATADAFIDAGMTNFLFETQQEISALGAVTERIRERTEGSFIIVTFAAGQDGYTRSGGYYRDLIHAALFALHADASGINCVCGPAHTLELLSALDTSLPIAALPNAGYPELVDGRTVYESDPGYFAQKLTAIRGLGVNILGGCCGTTPEHIRRFAQMSGGSVPLFVAERSAAKAPGERQPLPRGFAAVELSAPIDADPSFVLTAADSAREAGADFITVPDSPLGRARANSFMISSLIKRRSGAEVIPHLCCRDKNAIAIRGDLLAANIDGISHVLAVTGDPVQPAAGEAKGVFGMGSQKLIAFIKSLNETLFCARPYTIFAALNTSAKKFDIELSRAQKKLEAGADCFFTQPIFGERGIENLERARRELCVPVAAGIMPLSGYKNALFLSREVPGIDVPEELIEKLSGANREEALSLCLDHATGIADAIGGCDGWYIMTPLKNIALSTALVRHIKEGRK